MSDKVERARQFLAGEQFSFRDVNSLWKDLRSENELTLAWGVLERIRKENGEHLLDDLPSQPDKLDELCQQQALLISKDQELAAAARHDRAIKTLRERFPLDDPSIDHDSETLGIAGGIYKRKWEDLGRFEDLKRAADLYQRAAANPLGDDAYVQINAAYLRDLVALASDQVDNRSELPGNDLRRRIVDDLPVSGSWWNTATLAEALLGLGRYGDAADVLRGAQKKPQAWELQTTTRQLASIARLREKRPLKNPEIKSILDALLPGAAAAACSATIGKVGLALSGGGFRASFYHLGVLARLAELDVLRNIEVLSCVSGGSVVGACYWLALRRKLLESPSMTRQDYIDLIGELITAFEGSVAQDLRSLAQPSAPALVFRLLASKQKQGVLNPEDVASALEQHFLAPQWGTDPAAGMFMDQLPFTPRDHDQVLTGSPRFELGKHNWMRANKVPALILNATTVNTGRGWQFTATWMGESPWAINEEADVIERLEWAPYSEKWRISLARAVAASAAVPGIFAPLELGDSYPNVRVQLVDGGVNDNQGVASLLASNCNVLLVSDASGQLRLELRPQPGFKGFVSYANRAMDILMERVRQATFADLNVRRTSGAIRALLFLHMKAGLDAETIRLPFSQATFAVEHTALSPSGVRRDFQRAIAELRTDLDAFSPIESRALMACGYKMAFRGFEKQVAAQLPELWEEEEPQTPAWVFSEMLEEITSTAWNTKSRSNLLEALRAGSTVTVWN
jgi:predicted acylesterase/phospholipase RssA